MPKNRPSFLKRQREMAKKQQREAKEQRKRDRKEAALGARLNEGSVAPTAPDPANVPDPV